MKGEELYLYDAGVRAAQGIFCGVDEAGRGPLCGPVCCAAVMLDPADPIEGVNDSKKLSEKKREALYEQIIRRAAAYNVVMIGPEEIDRLNILEATMEGMRQAVAGLSPPPAFALIDGNRCPAGLALPAMSLVKGDGLSASIAAASILAKVSRDRYMVEMDGKYPGYGFAKHKGYGTKAHYAALDELGPCAIHRKSFLVKWRDRRERE